MDKIIIVGLDLARNSGVSIISLYSDGSFEGQAFSVNGVGCQTYFDIADLLIETLSSRIDLLTLNYVFVEGLAWGFRNRTVLFQLACLQIVVIYKFYKLGIRWKTLTPSTVKKTITGKGNADKKFVKSFIDKTQIVCNNLDESDAVAIALTGIKLWAEELWVR